MASQGPASISGRVRTADGAPLAEARVFFVSGPGSFPDVAALSNEDGAFTLTAPAPGAYEIQAAADGFAPGTVAVMVAAGAQASPEIVLAKM